MSDTFSIAHSTIFAARLPCSARGSMELRRTEMMANSAPTKKALAAISAKVSRATVMRPPPRSRRGRDRRVVRRRAPRRTLTSLSPTSSPTSAMRPRRAMTYPPTVSYAGSSGMTSPVTSSTSSGRSRPRTLHAPSGVRKASTRRRSCSSATSPTSSSTTSSRVTSPAVPPYSSTTIAIWCPTPRSSSSSAPAVMVSGMRGAGIMSSRTVVASRLGAGTAIAACK